MRYQRSRLWRALAGTALVAIALAARGFTSAAQTQRPPPKPDVIWLPTEDAVVSAMLTMARVTRTDVVYDLGCGDGRILIAAATRFGARGVGVEIDPELVKQARAAVARAGVGDKVTIIEGNIFDPAIKIGDATVVTLFLLESLNARLRETRFETELKPGTRIVSNAFTMGARWPPEKSQTVDNSTIYMWTIK
ncbi:MAG TPA: class I SAM-dependent methyltransferase [Vicinamibacterales bacterium]|nr:class I SAM-dependent methyltransferase [Vicinamibacterales bacterium]